MLENTIDVCIFNKCHKKHIHIYKYKIILLFYYFILYYYYRIFLSYTLCYYIRQVVCYLLKVNKTEVEQQHDLPRNRTQMKQTARIIITYAPCKFRQIRRVKFPTR